ncbi:MAG TPA: AI-2E family transporter [Pyrinomonadaceae bacterium]|nr:AI-2E family transporter [Pyrinomonadaceae bacterium]
MDKKTQEVAETAAATATEVGWMRTRFILRVIFTAIVVWFAARALLWAFQALESVILLVVLSIFFAYLIAPLVEMVRRPFKVGGRERSMPRAAAIGLVYLGIFGSAGIALYFLLPGLGNQITQFAKNAPGYFTSARARAQSMNDFYERYRMPQSARDAINRNITHVIETAGAYTTEGLGNILLSSLTYLPWLILIPILAFFLLKDADSFRRSALQMLPRGRWRWRGDEFFQDVNSTLAAYIRAQLTACLIIGLICTIGFYLIGVPYWLALGIVAGMLEFIPLVGPLVIAICAALITGFYSINQAILVVVFLGILRIVHDYVIYPRIIGQGIHLHPLAVILSILAGAELGGVAGIFLAIPVVAIGTVSYRHWLEHRGSEGIVADLLKPGDAVVEAAEAADGAEKRLPPEPDDEHPSHTTTPEEMARRRPDLTTGELKLPKQLEER